MTVSNEMLERFREYLKDEVIAARGAWDYKAALDALCDGEWLFAACRDLGISDDDMEYISNHVYDEIEHLKEAFAA